MEHNGLRDMATAKLFGGKFPTLLSGPDYPNLIEN